MKIISGIQLPYSRKIIANNYNFTTSGLLHIDIALATFYSLKEATLIKNEIMKLST